jgi:hypothetical protein
MEIVVWFLLGMTIMKIIDGIWDQWRYEKRRSK